MVVGSSEGEVIALNAADGAERWRVKVNGEVLSAPAVAPQGVIVRTVDGRLRGLALDTGKELWQYEQAVPRLSLRGTAVPVISGTAVICGFDNGKVVALNIADGALLWETTVAPSRGRTELERLVDIDSAVKVFGNDVFAVGFQGRVAMLALDTGQIWWAQDASSYRGLAVDDENVYISTAEGEVVALAARLRHGALAPEGARASWAVGACAHGRRHRRGGFPGLRALARQEHGCACGTRAGRRCARQQSRPLPRAIACS